MGGMAYLLSKQKTTSVGQTSEFFSEGTIPFFEAFLRQPLGFTSAETVPRFDGGREVSLADDSRVHYTESSGLFLWKAVGNVSFWRDTGKM